MRSDHDGARGATDVAIIGMAGRFPGARDVAEFWQNVRAGRESIATLSREEIAGAQTPDRVLDDPGFVPRHPVLEGVDLFDARFFKVASREADMMDPQHRLFLTSSHRAIEDAGYDPKRYAGRIGVFATKFIDTYLLSSLFLNPGLAGGDVTSLIHQIELRLGNEGDYLASLVSYKLDLRGPSMTVNTACSSSLVAVHLACQSLRSGESDMALAGGVAVRVPQSSGYLYRDGQFFSPDGHCRAFDRDARGTVFGNGVGVVVLKRLEDARRDGDRIDAVVRATAVNNDGSEKVGYTAPSVAGQSELVARCLELAGVGPREISYVEAHGTGTPVGDPIEVEALARAYRRGTDERGYCALGSVKANIGHLRNAAGIAGFIKAALVLRHRFTPPSVNFRAPNPAIDFEASPFFVATEGRPWPDGAAAGPRYAAVNSLGVGGTNAHAVLQEWVEEAPRRRAGPGPAPRHLLPLSAKSEVALEAGAARLAAHLEAHPDLDLADVALTLQLGRGEMPYRRAVVCEGPAQAARALRGEGPATAGRVDDERAVAFMFPGQGSQRVNMARDVYEGERAFRETVDTCSALLEPRLGLSLRDKLYPRSSGAADGALDDTHLAQLALFVVEYALARLLMGWGLAPCALIGHSIGEYVAACLAGVFSLEDALALLAERGELMRAAPRGEMLAVSLPVAQIEAYLGPDLSLAAINGPSQCVLAGAADAVERARSRLKTDGHASVRLRTSHAFHSHLMDGPAARFADVVGRFELHAPRIPFVANHTGAWVTDEQAQSPAHWGRHLRSTVRFAEGLAVLAELPDVALLEVGPGVALAGLVRERERAGAAAPPAVASLPPPRDGRPDGAALLGAVAQLWAWGVPVDWRALGGGRDARRVALPTYSFEEKRHWIEPAPLPSPSAAPSGGTVEAPKDAADAGPAPAPADPVDPVDLVDGEATGPAGPLQAFLLGVWRELFGTEDVTVDSNFFELGGHSLMVARVFARVEERFGYEVPPGIIFERPTVRELAEHIASADWSAGDDGASLEPGELETVTL
jgi:phthiocerol/phenolphthiocerol synthesis type-I polyketide synthase E